MSIKSKIVVVWNKLSNAVKGIIFPPIYQQAEDLSTRSNLLRLFTMITMFLALLILAEALLVAINKPMAALQAILLFLISLCTYLLNKKGYFRAAVIIYIVSLWIGSSFTILVSGGMSGPYGFAYVIAVAIAGLLLGPRTVWAATAFITLSGLAIVFLEQVLYPLPIIYPSPSFGVWVNLSILIILVTVAIQYTQNRASQAFDQSTRDLEARKSTEHALIERDNRCGCGYHRRISTEDQSSPGTASGHRQQSSGDITSSER